MKKYKITEYTEILLNNELKSYLIDIKDECKDKNKWKERKCK